MFVGAGVSMVPPSCLPSWWQVSHVILDALAEVATTATPMALELADGIKRREAENKLPPEFASEVLTYSLGDLYFDALASVDGGRPNRVHRWLAALARARALPAIVTTNFDTLIEQACAEMGVEARVLVCPADYDGLDLAAHLADPGAPLLLLKVHGTAARPQTCIDTLAQRKQGFKGAMAATLRALVARTRFCVLGYSGADLAAEPNYLFLRQMAAAGAPGLVWLTREGSLPLAAVGELLSVYGPERAQAVAGSLPGWIDDLGAAALGGAVAPPPDSAEPHDGGAAVTAVLKDRTERWARDLGAVGAATAIAKLAEAASLSTAALAARRQIVDYAAAHEPDSCSHAVTLIYLSESVDNAGAPLEARALSLSALRLFERFGDVTGQLDASERYIENLQQAGSFLETKPIIEGLIEVARASGLKDEVLDLQAKLADTAFALGDAAEAARLIDVVKADAQATGDEMMRAHAEEMAANLLGRLGRLAEASELQEDAIAVYRRLGLDSQLVGALLGALQLAMLRSDLATADERLAECETLAHVLGDVTLAARAARMRALRLVIDGHVADAIDLLRRTAQAFRDLGDEDDGLACTTDLVPLLTASARFDEAIEEGRASVERGEELGLLPLVAGLGGNLAIALEAAGRLDEAEALGRRTLEVSRQLGNRSYELNALGNLGNVAYRRGDLVTAEAHYREAAAIADAVALPAARVQCLTNLANVLAMKGPARDAIPVFRKALSICDQDGLAGLKVGLQINLGLTEWRVEEFAAAAEAFEAARAQATEAGDLVQAGFAAYNEACVLVRAGRPVAAPPLLKQALDAWAGLDRPEISEARRMLSQLEAAVPGVMPSAGSGA